MMACQLRHAIILFYALILFERPLYSVFGVLDVEAEGGELVADQVGC